MTASIEDTAKNPALPSGRSGLPWIGLALAVIALDQVSKAWILAHFELFETYRLLPVLDITQAHNLGAAFSVLATASGWQRWLFTGLAVLVSLVIVVWLKRLDGVQQRILAMGLTLIMGGALGNVIDRIHYGYVVDFISVHWNSHYFPAFNAADSCITMGAGLLILDALFDWRRAKVR
jgi:signal peptidase II